MQDVTLRRLKFLLCLPLILQFALAVAWFQANPPTSQSKEESQHEREPSRSSTEQARVSSPEKQVPAAQNPREQAWEILETAGTGNKVADRTNATRVLGLVRDDAKARGLAEKALLDPKPEVRVAAATALGDMRSRRSISKLKKALDDPDPSVALAAANSLRLMHNASAYEVYSEVLTKERKGTKGLISSQKSTFSDPKKVAELGFEEGIGFVPFAGIGWRAIREVKKNDPSPVRAAAAKVLADDPDPAATKVLEDAADDKSWIVRAAALEALARRGDPSALDTVQMHLVDEKDVVRYTAAASTLRLMEIKKAKADSKAKPATK